MHICTCNNCGEIYEDMNPSKESIDYPEQDLDQLRYINVNEATENDGIHGKEMAWVCPKCLTDEHLIDNHK